MLLPFTKYFFITLCIFYFFRNLLGISSPKRMGLIDAFFSFLITFVVQYLKPYMGILELSTLVLLSSLFLKFYHKISFKTSVLTTTVSFILSFFASTIASYITIPVKILFFCISFQGLFSDFVTFLVIGCIQLVLVRIPFRFKRLKNGMPFLQYDSLQNLGFLVSILFLLCHSIQKNTSNGDTQLVIFIVQLFLSLCVILLFVWWSQRLKAVYLKKLKEREMESLKQEILLLQKEMESLKQDNQELSKLIHKDNKLIPAMEYTITTLFHSATFTDTSTQEQAHKLLAQLKSISNERKGILTTYENTYVQTTNTGVISVDAMCQYMKHYAQEKGVHFQFNISANVKHFTEHILPEDKLTTLLADLTENAIISTNGCKTRNVLLCIGMENNIYHLNIFDSGNLFERQPLLHLGINRFTTHSKEGGSGIGLMTTCEILKTYNASFILDECGIHSPYTKVISIYFDGLGQIRVKSRRPEILHLSQDRRDILFFNACNYSVPS